MKKSIAYIVSFGGLAATFLPVVAAAQQGGQIFGILSIVQNTINVLIPILITAAVAYFIYGVIKYVTAKDEEARKEGRSVMIYGIIGLFVIVSIWGLIRSLGRATGVGQGGTDCLVDPTLSGC